jgi:hypothetical protein
VVQTVASGEIEVPDRYNDMVKCLMPSHEDRTPSFKVDSQGFFKCFGCQAGGDLIKFVEEYLQVSATEAVSHIEELFGLSKADPKSTISRAKLEGRTKSKKNYEIEKKWKAGLLKIELEFVDKTNLLLWTKDPLVVSLCEGPLFYIHDEIASARVEVPITRRGLRDGLKKIRTYSDEIYRWCLKEVLRVTGKDRLDILRQQRC